jgi:hypothetical protein
MEATTALLKRCSLAMVINVLWQKLVEVAFRGIHLQNQTVSQPRLLQYEEFIYLSMPVQSFLLDLGGFFSFLIPYTVCRTPWTGDQPVARPLPTNRTT